MSSESSLRIVGLYPDLLSTYGDRGNLLVLANRAARRGLRVETLEVHFDEPVPESGDLYLIGGGEDGPQILAAERLRTDGGLGRAVARGAAVLAICAGYQVLGEWFDAKGRRHAGVGLLDCRTHRGAERAVGEVVAEPSSCLNLPTLSGFENHGGRTSLGPGVAPLARVITGVGNDRDSEGALCGRIIGTYLHGPVLARNPALADLLLSWVVGATFAPLDDTWTSKLREERFAAAAR